VTVPSSPAGLSGNMGALLVPELLATALSKADEVVFEEDAAALAVVLSQGLGRGGSEAIAKCDLVCDEGIEIGLLLRLRPIL